MSVATPQRYCEPLYAGLPNEPRAAGRRIGHLLDSLDNEVNGCIVKGKIADDIRAFRNSLIVKLEADGWRVRWRVGLDERRWSVLPPKEPK